MKICVLTHTFPRTPKDTTAAFMKEFSDGLVQAGANVVVLTPFDKSFNRPKHLFKIKTYKYVWPDSLHILGYSQTMENDLGLKKRAFLLLPLFIFFGTLALYKTVKREKIDLVNVHWILPNGLIALFVFWLTKVPYAITIPGTDAYLAYRYKLFGWVARLIAKNSAGLVSNSSLLLNRITDLGIGKKKTAVYSYPVNVSVYRPLKEGIIDYRRRHGISKDDLVLLAVGRFVYKKGYAYLIKAIPHVLKRFPKTKLVMGGDGGLRRQLEELAATLGITDNVLFIGNIDRDSIVYYYNMADVMVSPSVIDRNGNVDGGPVVSFESMACGKPQVVTDILGVADFIENGINGFKVPQKKTRELAKAIIKILESRSLRDKMGRVNRKLVLDKFGTKKVGEYYLNFFKEVLYSKQQ
ncbi:MAG: Glycosyl transferase group 1 [Candidatus Woesebacteria bacterium GW2011_GWB1_41_10]|uniref:Glycosyl transferase group 1 n=1 Tax=Candidatus Woesebacteria bacterium GW2011_GWB1_41_10 TaxID=1618577 RepID=A0A0G0UH80_9BACT|nr:MAG: Glycosyl transferase group 1 [Candidatus Woesebacteria bacterium GW2011_GWB1_41_10]